MLQGLQMFYNTEPTLRKVLLYYTVVQSVIVAHHEILSNPLWNQKHQIFVFIISYNRTIDIRKRTYLYDDGKFLNVTNFYFSVAQERLRNIFFGFMFLLRQ